MSYLSSSTGASVFSKAARQKATIFTVVLIVLSIFRVVTLSSGIVPILLVHALLLINTYFSLRIFASIQPCDCTQNILDLILVLLYLWMTYVLDNPLMYSLAFAAMFSVSIVKYVSMLGVIPQTTLVRHKLQMQAFGVLSGIFVAVGIEHGVENPILWVWALGFFIVQIDIFLVRPLYVFHSED